MIWDRENGQFHGQAEHVGMQFMARLSCGAASRCTGSVPHHRCRPWRLYAHPNNMSIQEQVKAGEVCSFEGISHMSRWSNSACGVSVVVNAFAELFRFCFACGNPPTHSPCRLHSFELKADKVTGCGYRITWRKFTTLASTAGVTPPISLDGG